MAIDGTEVLDSEVLKEALWCDEIFEPLLHSMERLIDAMSYDRCALEYILTPIEELLIPLRGTESGKMFCHTADRR